MNILRLFYIYILILSLSAFASESTNIKILQNNFYTEVLKIKVYKKFFKTYLNKKCSIGDNKCYNSFINILEDWETTKDNNLLNEKLSYINKFKSLNQIYWKDVQNKLHKEFSSSLYKTQFVSIIDLEQQLYILTLWDYEKSQFYYIGCDFISSGDMNRELEVILGEDHYFNSPVGIFTVKSGWRSDGKNKYDEFTFPYGEKDRYIFYFGKQKGMRYNTFDKNSTKIKNKDDWKLITGQFEFAMHAHQSIYTLGKKKSHGCIRISNELNLFLDNNFVLHKNMIDNGKWKHPYIKEPQTPINIDLAGQYLMIFDKI